MLEHPIATERSRVRPPDRDLDRVADLIAKSERVVIFGGAGCMEARADVLQLSQLLNAPVGFTFRGKDILEAANPNAVGMTGLLGWGGAHGAIAECDLLLMLGTDFPYHPFMPEKSTIVQIDEQAGHLGRRAKVDIGLVGDVGETLRALLPRLQQRSGREFLDKILAIHVAERDCVLKWWRVRSVRSRPTMRSSRWILACVMSGEPVISACGKVSGCSGPLVMAPWRTPCHRPLGRHWGLEDRVSHCAVTVVSRC
jgi:pyruvate dehydrogenase (quinone)